MENEGVSQDATGVITGGDTTISPPVPQPETEPVQAEVPDQAVPEIVVPESVAPSEQVVVREETVSQPEAQPETQPDIAPTSSTPTPDPVPQPVQSVEVAVQQPANTNKSLITELLLKARAKIQFKKRLKLEKIMGLFAKKPKITNDEVEKVLHVSDSTATRYLDQLEKENKIRQNGKTGKGVMYTKN